MNKYDYYMCNGVVAVVFSTHTFPRTQTIEHFYRVKRKRAPFTVLLQILV